MLSHKEPNLSWAPKPNLAETTLQTTLPPRDQISTVHGFIITGDNQIVLTDHTQRGVGLPGGHIEEGESFTECFEREVYEEVGAKVSDIELVAVRKIHHLGEKPEGYKYSFPVSQMLYVRAVLVSFDEFTPTAESYGPKLVHANEFIATGAPPAESWIFENSLWERND